MGSSSISKPPGLTYEHATQFKDSAIVRAYRFREPYSAEVFTILNKLCGLNHPRVLDLGCGCGDLTFGLSEFAKTVDAVDFSKEMLDEAKRRVFHKTNITWHEAAVESAEFSGPPFDLITSAQSFHWMDWQLTSQKICTWLKPGGYFAIVSRQYSDRSWWNANLQSIIDQYTTNREFKKYDLIEEIRKSDLFNIHGDQWTKPVSFQQSIADLVESFHSRNGFSRDRLTEKNAAAFDQAASDHLKNFCEKDVMHLSAISRVTWMTVN